MGTWRNLTRRQEIHEGLSPSYDHETLSSNECRETADNNNTFFRIRLFLRSSQLRMPLLSDMPLM